MKQRAKCLECGVELEVDQAEKTASPSIVRIAHGCSPRSRVLATLLEEPPPINLHEEAKRIFGDELVERPTTGNPPDEPPLGTPMEGVVVEETSASGQPDVSVADAPASDDTPDDRVQAAYAEWMTTPDGRAVARAIRDRALELRRRGWSRYGIQALAEVVRYDQAIRAGPDDAGYRVNNSHLSSFRHGPSRTGGCVFRIA